MKKSSYLFLFLYLLMTNSLYAIEANISYATFNGLEQENYVEIYLHLKGKTIEFVKHDDKMYQAAVEVTLLFKQDEAIKAFDRYVLKSPKIYSKKMSNLGVVDLKRLNLPNGDYDLEVILEDLNDLDNKKTYTTKISMDYSLDDIQVSDIELLGKYTKTVEEDKYSKHGFQLKPFTYTIYPSYQKRLVFFTEIYNTSKLEGDYLVRYYLTEQNGTEPILGALGFKKQEPNAVNAVLAQLDISTLPTGKYKLVVEVRNGQNELLTSKSLLIHRSNLLDYDIKNFENEITAGTFVEPMEKLAVKHAIQSLVPRLSGADIPLVNKISRSKDLEQQKRFLLHFWIGEDEVDPSAPFENYQEEVDYVNSRFSSAFNKGFETDRGYIFLRYGPPKDIMSSDSEPTASPYQIWAYDILDDNQRNVKFVFYNPSLAAEDYVLLHSTARGEISDPQWQKKIYRSFESKSAKEALEGTGVQDHFGGNRAGDLFNDW